MMHAGSALTITFSLYILLMVGIGLVAYFYTRNLSDYILGGRRLGSFVVAMSAGASDMSGWLLMGLPGAVFINGISEAWIAVGLSIGAWCNWKWVAGRLRVYTERASNALTLPDYFTYRFEDKSGVLRILSAVIILLFFAVYASSGAVAGALLFESTFGIPYANALWIGAAATIAYTLIGGFLAVSWTDTVQATLMIAALIITPITVIALTGGPSQSMALVQQIDPKHFNLLASGSSTIGIISLLAWGLGYFGQPHILARFMSASSYSAIGPARRISITWMVLCLAGAIAVGFFGIAYFAQHSDQAAAVQQNPERVFVVLSQVLFNPWVAGVLLSAILAAIMSTLSCQLLVCSSVLTEDFYKAFLRKNAGQTELVWIGRLTVLLVSLLAIWLAQDPKNSILALVSYAWGGFGASFGPVVIISLLWRRMTRNGALVGMLAGALTVVFWKQGFAPESLKELYEILPGALACTVGIVLVSLLDKAPSASIQKTFDEVNAEVKRYQRAGT